MLALIEARHRAPARPGRQPAFRAHAARLAVRSLYAELALYPKPGLVSLVDNGSHEDMDATTFLRSLFSLRRYFADICDAGMQGAPFQTLKRLGIDAEQRMLRATAGVNTHRGAIFSLGMLCAAMGHCHGRGIVLSAEAIRSALVECWGQALAVHSGDGNARSHGTRVLLRYAASGAREEAARGLPSVFEIGLPVLRRTLAAGRGMRAARVDALFALMAHVSDTNVYHRGGERGAAMVRSQSRAFVARGGTAARDWEASALACHRSFVAERLSPGGAADLLAAVCLVHAATL